MRSNDGSIGRRGSRAGAKPGIGIDIPGFGHLHIQAICSDYTGTLSCEGELIKGVSRRLRKLGELVDIHVVTSDTRKTAGAQLKRLPVRLHDKITSEAHDAFKRDYLTRIGVALKRGFRQWKERQTVAGGGQGCRGPRGCRRCGRGLCRRGDDERQYIRGRYPERARSPAGQQAHHRDFAHEMRTALKLRSRPAHPRPITLPCAPIRSR